MIEKLDSCSSVMSNDRPHNVKGICAVLIKMFDRMVREPKEVRYISQLKRNLISVGGLEVLGLEVSVRDGVLKMTRESMVVLKGI